MADDLREPFTTDNWAKRITIFGAIGVTLFIFGLFSYGLIVAATSQDHSTFNGLLETVKALTMVAAGYWIGTSHSSAKKDDIIAHNADLLATSVPTSTIPPGSTVTSMPPPGSSVSTVTVSTVEPTKES